MSVPVMVVKPHVDLWVAEAIRGNRRGAAENLS